MPRPSGIVVSTPRRSLRNSEAGILVSRSEKFDPTQPEALGVHCFLGFQPLMVRLSAFGAQECFTVEVVYFYILL